MTPKIKVNLSEAICEKPVCFRTKCHRHHKGHEFLFTVRWMNRDLGAQRAAWVKRYWQFRPRDTVRICGRHHAEIHLIYDQIIMDHNFKLGKRLDNYTFREAMQLRSKLRKVCDEWIKQKTPGKPEKSVFGRARTKNQRRAERKKRDA